MADVLAETQTSFAKRMRPRAEHPRAGALRVFQAVSATKSPST